MIRIRIISVNSPVLFKNRSVMPPAKASKILETGPAAATFIISVLGFLSNRLSTGTGLAQPKPAKRIINEPITSRCAVGFRVSLPILAAVLSPHLAAIQAWANSWKDKANTNVGIKSTSASSGRRNNKISSEGDVFYTLLLKYVYQDGYRSA